MTRGRWERPVRRASTPGQRLGERLAGLREAFAWRRQLGAAAQFVAIEPQQLAGGAVGVDHLGPGVLDQHPLLDRVECGGSGEGRIGHAALIPRLDAVSTNYVGKRTRNQSKRSEVLIASTTVAGSRTSKRWLWPDRDDVGIARVDLHGWVVRRSRR